MAIKRVSSEQARQLTGMTDWTKVDAMTDEDIEAAAKDDPDSPLLSEEELKEFKPWKGHEKVVEVRKIRVG